MIDICCELKDIEGEGEFGLKEKFTPPLLVSFKKYKILKRLIKQAYSVS